MAFDACSIQAHRNKVEKTEYTDEVAEKFAKEVGAIPRPQETKSEIDERGVFIRQPNYFTQKFGDKEGDLKAEANKYIIYWSHGCNWSNRPLIARDILGLDCDSSSTSKDNIRNMQELKFLTKLDNTGCYNLTDEFVDFCSSGNTISEYILKELEEYLDDDDDLEKIKNYMKIFNI